MSVPPRRVPLEIDPAAAAASGAGVLALGSILWAPLAAGAFAASALAGVALTANVPAGAPGGRAPQLVAGGLLLAVGTLAVLPMGTGARIVAALATALVVGGVWARWRARGGSR